MLIALIITIYIIGLIGSFAYFTSIWGSILNSKFIGESGELWDLSYYTGSPTPIIMLIIWPITLLAVYITRTFAPEYRTPKQIQPIKKSSKYQIGDWKDE